MAKWVKMSLLFAGTNGLKRWLIIYKDIIIGRIMYKTDKNIYISNVQK